jgi:AraC-like DNA-binding protein
MRSRRPPRSAANPGSLTLYQSTVLCCTSGQYRCAHLPGICTSQAIRVVVGRMRQRPAGSIVVGMIQHRHIVTSIEDIVRSHLDQPLHLSDLCRIASVTEHSVRSAFRRVYRATPSRYLREIRMSEARKALLAPDSNDLTVTDVAMRFGFYEIGRFSVNYRLRFGESPSTTLRRAYRASRQSSPGKPASVAPAACPTMPRLLESVHTG